MQIIANAYCRFFGHRSDDVKGYSKKIGRDVYYKCVRCGKDFFAYRELPDLSKAKKLEAGHGEDWASRLLPSPVELEGCGGPATHG